MKKLIIAFLIGALCLSIAPVASFASKNQPDSVSIQKSKIPDRMLAGTIIEYDENNKMIIVNEGTPIPAVPKTVKKQLTKEEQKALKAEEEMVAKIKKEAKNLPVYKIENPAPQPGMRVIYDGQGYIDEIVYPASYDIGNSAWEQGVRSYKSTIYNNDDDIVIEFTHKDMSKEGILYSKIDNHSNKFYLKLERNKSFLIIDWNAIEGKLLINDEKMEPVIFTFDEIGKKWVGNKDNAFDIFNKYFEDIKLMVSISEDFIALNSPEKDNLPTTSSLCPDYDNMIQGGPVYDTYRSQACEAAHADAASKCSNEYCYGCYSYVGDFDCVCLGGDMFCRCVRFGYPCTLCDY